VRWGKKEQWHNLTIPFVTNIGLGRNKKHCGVFKGWGWWGGANKEDFNKLGCFYYILPQTRQESASGNEKKGNEEQGQEDGERKNGLVAGMTILGIKNKRNLGRGRGGGLGGPLRKMSGSGV